jgi:ATP-dependent DNA ligase
MALPISRPLKPQLAKSKPELPEGDGWAYEPKLDGFRAIVFVDGDDFDIRSRNDKDLKRYFPELTFAPGHYVLDGEIVILGKDGGEEFDLLGQRIHPAQSRIDRLSKETPATFVAFDVLVCGGEAVLDKPYSERRKILESMVKPPLQLIPSVSTPAEAEQWLQNAEGVIAKETAAPYQPGARKGMFKIKRVRTIDAVVCGWRPGKAEGTVGALILGLYEGDDLRVVGHSSGFSAKEKKELPARLAPYETGQRGAGDPSRWSNGRELEWIELRPELVVEITFDHVSDGRIRHGTKVLRWRDDKAPKDCALSQMYS